MKKNNRIKLHIIIFAVILVFSSNINFAYAKDVDVYSEENALQLLYALGIADRDFTPSASKNVTRAQFAIYAAKMMLNTDFKLNSDANLPFSDVAVNDEAFPYIAFLFDQKIIAGSGGGLFRPDDNITVEEMSKILLGITGYLPVAESTSLSYTAIAASQDLFGTIEFSDFINESTLVEILYRTLLSAAYSSDEYSNDGSYKLKKDKTVLEEYFGVAQYSGIYDANDKTSLVGSGTGKEGIITVDGIKYKVNIEIPENLFGNTVVYYARENEGLPNEIICMYRESGNSEIVLNDDEIESVDGYKIEYSSNDGKTRKVTVDSNADFIYNNIAYNKWKMADVLITNGTVTLIDNNNDNKIDVIKVMSYDDYVALSYGSAGKNIALHFGGNISLDDKDCEYSLYKDGKIAEWDSISDWDILSVAKSHMIDGKYYCRIDVTHSGVSGTVEETFDDGIVINGIEYKTVAASRSQLDVKAGESGTFYKNILGKIVASDNKDRLKYAYVRDSYLDADDGKRVYLHLMYDSYTDKKTVCAKKINIDAQPKKDTDVINAVSVGDVIRFKTNADGEITDIDTANGENTSSPNSLLDGGSFSDVQYKAGGANVFLKAVIIDNDTKVFVVPFDDDDLFYLTADINYFRSDMKYDLRAYDLSETRVAKVLVVKEKPENRAVNDSNSISVVNGIKRKVNDNGEECISLELIRDGLEIDSLWIDLDDWEKFSSLKIGDIVTYAESSDDNCRIALLKILFSPSADNTYYHKNISSAGTKLIVTYGKVTARDDQSLLINTDSTDESIAEPYYIKPKMIFYIYDSKNKEVKTGTLSDVIIGDEVFLRESYYAVQEGFIVR